MRVVFMGTPAFAVPSLKALLAHHDVALVVTRPDGPAGRGHTLRPTAVKSAALEAGIDVFQPAKLDAEARERIAAARPDVICVAAFGALLPSEVLAIPPCGCINVHASLLPRYRGAAPIQRSILAGDAETGVSIMRMEQGLDTGPYATRCTVAIGQRYAAEVEEELAVKGAEALLAVLTAIESGSVTWTQQDESQATYAAKIKKDDVALTPALRVDDALARVRASTDRAPARACVGSRDVTIVRAHAVRAQGNAGGVWTADGVPVLGFADGALALDVVRPAGRADMPGADWARGARLVDDTCWRCTR